MKVDVDELSGRARGLSDDLAKIVGDMTDRLTDEGKSRVRQAVGAPEPSAMWTTFAAGAIFGIVVGVVIGMLVAPRSGTEMRTEIAGRMSEARNGIGERRTESAYPSGTTSSI